MNLHTNLQGGQKKGGMGRQVTESKHPRAQQSAGKRGRRGRSSLDAWIVDGRCISQSMLLPLLLEWNAKVPFITPGMGAQARHQPET